MADTQPTGAPGGTDPWGGTLTYLFEAPGVPPWPVFEGGGVTVGWVHVPTGLTFGPKTYGLADASHRPLLQVTQRGGITAGGYRVLGAAGGELGVLRLVGIGGLGELRVELTVGGVAIARLETDLDALVATGAPVTVPTGTAAASVALASDEGGRRWFALRWHGPSVDPVRTMVIALPLALHAELSERAAFQRSRSDDPEPRSSPWRGF